TVIRIVGFGLIPSYAFQDPSCKTEGPLVFESPGQIEHRVKVSILTGYDHLGQSYTLALVADVLALMAGFGPQISFRPSLGGRFGRQILFYPLLIKDRFINPITNLQISAFASHDAGKF